MSHATHAIPLLPPQSRRRRAGALPVTGVQGGFIELTPQQRTTTRCVVCGFTEVRTDEVIDRGVVLLSECPRCDHRWTERSLSLARVSEGRAGGPSAA